MEVTIWHQRCEPRHCTERAFWHSCRTTIDEQRCSCARANCCSVKAETRRGWRISCYCRAISLWPEIPLSWPAACSKKYWQSTGILAMRRGCSRLARHWPGSPSRNANTLERVHCSRRIWHTVEHWLSSIAWPTRSTLWRVHYFLPEATLPRQRHWSKRVSPCSEWWAT